MIQTHYNMRPINVNTCAAEGKSPEAQVICNPLYGCEGLCAEQNAAGAAGTVTSKVRGCEYAERVNFFFPKVKYLHG
ncbi:hypothetical protein SDC9_68295 [bioreactor metagenome]|uniref:Uncharacterized protein n=1 Tax=bioreactor metagenome TaxID=1076179 RepID=A0A644Y009_9ZZZZ